MEAYDQVVALSKNLPLFYERKYTAKAMENKASVIVLTSDYPQVLKIIADTEKLYTSEPLSQNQELQVKFNIKKAQLLKKCSFFREAFRLLSSTLEKLE